MDIDLGLPVTLGLWHRLRLDFDAVAGQWHVRIEDAATSATLLDQMGIFSNWTSTF